MNSVVLSSTRPRLARHARLQFDPVRGRHVVLAPEGVLVVNHTGAAILDLCDGRTVDDITDELRGWYGDVATDDVQTFLTRLVVRRWVEVGDA